MEKPQPKRSLLDDQPFLSRLDALDQEIRKRPDVRGGLPPSEPQPDGDPERLAAPGAPPAEPAPIEAAAVPPTPASTLTYEPFFGLSEKPFSLASDPRFFYRSDAHRAVFEQLFAAIRRREGIVVLTGDVGAGKTTLCRTVVGQLDRQTFTARLDDPFLSFEELLKQLLIDFGVVSREDVTSGRMAHLGRHELTLALQEFLRSLALLQAFALVIVDEAQNASPALLENLRILSDIGGSGHLLQILLVGQPDLLERLSAPGMRAFNQRITVRASLGPLGPEDVSPYVVHRLSVAGGSVAFTKEAIAALGRVSHGVPRILNLACDRALTIGASEGSDRIDGRLVARAVDDLGFSVPGVTARPSSWRRRPVAAALAVMGLAAMVTVLVVWQPGPVRAGLADWAGLPPMPAARPLAAGDPIAPVPPPVVSAAATSAAAESGDFAIQVGTFHDADRAGRLVASLQQLNFRVYTVPVDLGARGQWQAVLVGRYADRAAADTDLRRLQASGEYGGARVLRVGR